MLIDSKLELSAEKIILLLICFVLVASTIFFLCPKKWKVTKLKLLNIIENLNSKVFCCFFSIYRLIDFPVGISKPENNADAFEKYIYPVLHLTCLLYDC